MVSGKSVSQIRLPLLIGSGAVLQRETPITLWGWASQGEAVELVFKEQHYSAQADASGNWKINLPPQSAGGPFEMVFRGKNEIIVQDILFGDVWICSGQSNMELPMERVKEKYLKEIAQSENKFIRHFQVADQYDFKKEHDDLESANPMANGWSSADPQSVMNFSAVAYFFAKEIYKQHQIPIGLINSALGGSPVQAWMSEKALLKFPEYHEEAQRFKNDSLIQQIEAGDRERSNDWYQKLDENDPGLAQNWIDPNLDDQSWDETSVPGYWYGDELRNFDGTVWYRKAVKIPGSMAGKKASLWMGRIVDADSVFVNGKFVGTTSYQYPPRRYTIKEGILKEGENQMAVRVINNSGRGGFVPDKPYYLAVDSDTIHLSGLWQYKIGATMPPMAGQTFVRWKPLGLFNKMIAPLLHFPIKGVIWYQGEANTYRPEEYADLFPAMITDWRERWGQGDFPFLFVQLAGFMETKDEPAESNWAQLRNSQRLTLSKAKNTAMVVATDLGEWNDIHPLNKKDVGYRLSLAARKIAYHEEAVIASGPLYESMKVLGNKIEISFTNIGSGLVATGGDLKYFAIAGADKKFKWASAVIQGDKVIVWNDSVKNPVAVRYAWADNPEGANLYNKEGLPASPFSTEK
jgi:sialate O-acetylesterase